MGGASGGAGSAPWRVIVITNIPGGLVYTLADGVIRSLGHRIVGVVTSPGPMRRRSDGYLDVVAAVAPNVDTLVSNHPRRWAAMLASLEPDLIICGGMPWRVPADVLALPRLGAINLHPALLPRHRGPAAIEWAFRSGDAELGFTVHRMSPDFDTGPVLAQTTVPIEDDDDFNDVMSKLGPKLPDVLMRALARVAQGEEGEPQDESAATYAGLLEEEWRTIDWSQPARNVHNQVRSWIGMRDSSKGAFGLVDGERLHITRTRLLPPDPDNRREFGKVVRRNGETIVVQCGDGPLEVIEWTRPGETGADAPTPSS
ncbi:MAG: methionyl-tRNA formyltransferase [Thermomicrobiales bacterium]|nr:methionyl-tRNA formyltransferase [Thermomicrobiales bacterium]